MTFRRSTPQFFFCIFDKSFLKMCPPPVSGPSFCDKIFRPSVLPAVILAMLLFRQGLPLPSIPHWVQIKPRRGGDGWADVGCWQVGQSRSAPTGAVRCASVVDRGRRRPRRTRCHSFGRGCWTPRVCAGLPFSFLLRFAAVHNTIEYAEILPVLFCLTFDLLQNGLKKGGGRQSPEVPRCFIVSVLFKICLPGVCMFTRNFLKALC